MNLQKPEPRATGDGASIDFHSLFFTIQGEGPFSGRRAVFVRLAGCNLQCPGCDTEYTDGRQMIGIQWLRDAIFAELYNFARENQSRPPIIVITGGEPFRQNIGPLLVELSTLGTHIQIESNGVFAPPAEFEGLQMSNSVSLVVSPKTSKIHPECHRLADAFKYVLDYRSVSALDGLPVRALDHPAALGVARPTRSTVPIYLNPYDAQDVEHNQRNLRAVAQSCQRFGYIMGVQLHKLAGLE